MKKIYLLFIAVSFLLISPNNLKANDLAENLKGRILLQVEEHGEAWYVNTDTKKRHFLGRPADAFNIMRELGLGITESDYYSFNNYAPKRLSGKILLRVQASGEAYYVNPVDLKMHYLGRPADAFNVMRTLGLGISNYNLNKISASDFNYYRNTKYGFEFQYPKSISVKEENNTITIHNGTEHGGEWTIDIYNNYNQVNISTWFNNYFNSHKNKDCQTSQSNLNFNNEEAVLISSKGMDDLCEDGGYYVINDDKFIILKWSFGHDPIYMGTIIDSFKFTN